MYLKFPFNGKNSINLIYNIVEGRKEEPSYELKNKYSPELREIENKLLSYVFILLL
jgi:hypothetical protein